MWGHSAWFYQVVSDQAWAAPDLERFAAMRASPGLARPVVAFQRIAGPERREKVILVALDRSAVLLERGDHRTGPLLQVPTAFQRLQSVGQLEDRLEALVVHGRTQISAEGQHAIAEKVGVGLGRFIAL